jgi:flagellar hook protein FlgE
MNAIATAQYGLFAAGQRFSASAERVSRMGDPNADVDLGSEVVEQVSAKAEFSANLAVIRVADDMNQALLDILA